MTMLLIYAAVFVAVCTVIIRLLGRRGVFWSCLGVLGLGWLFFFAVFPGVRLSFLGLNVTIPGMAMIASGSKSPLPVPSFAFMSYMVLTIAGILIVVSSSDELFSEFMGPILTLLRGPAKPSEGVKSRRFQAARIGRIAFLFVLLPLLAGWIAFGKYRPSTAVPVAGRQAHPSIPYKEKLENPLRNPSSETLKKFAKDNKLGELSGNELRDRYIEAMRHEGRHLYAKNCAPCHGAKADGTGLMARALRLPPANFTDVGTIKTIVEAYAYKRIEDGGIGLPQSGTPWDSAMPRWKNDLKPDEIFKILLAEYDLAGVSPRVPEKH